MRVTYGYRGGGGRCYNHKGTRRVRLETNCLSYSDRTTKWVPRSTVCFRPKRQTSAACIHVYMYASLTLTPHFFFSLLSLNHPYIVLPLLYASYRGPLVPELGGVGRVSYSYWSGKVFHLMKACWFISDVCSPYLKSLGYMIALCATKFTCVQSCIFDRIFRRRYPIFPIPV